MKQNVKTVKRGEIYYYDFGGNEGSIQSGYRPVLVLQGNHFNAYAPTVTVAAITTAMKKRYLPTHVELGPECGLQQPSMVLLEQVRTVNKDMIGKYIGSVDDPNIWKEINRGIRLMFDLYSNKQTTGDVRCLCNKCRQNYMDNPKYIVRRVDPLAKEKDHCDKCNAWGYEYLLYEKKNRT